MATTGKTAPNHSEVRQRKTERTSVTGKKQAKKDGNIYRKRFFGEVKSGTKATVRGGEK